MRFNLLVLGLFAALAVGAACTRAEIAANATHSELAATSLTPEPAVDDVPRISLADAKKDYDAGTTVFVDVRPIADYDKEHVKGSISVPPGFIAKHMQELKGKKIIAYCS